MSLQLAEAPLNLELEPPLDPITLENKGHPEFNLQITGNEDLLMQLEEFQKACMEHEKHFHKRCKRRYYNLGLMARIVVDTTDDEFTRLLQNSFRTFLIDTVTNKIEEVETMLEKTDIAICTLQKEDKYANIVVGKAMEIKGDCCRVGRMRNNCSVLIQRGAIITLTTDESYRYCGFKEIFYVINLKFYIRALKLHDEIFLGNEIRARVVKILKINIALLIEAPGIVNSYDYIELPNQCYCLSTTVFPEMYTDDLEMAQRLGAHYIVLQKVRCKPFLKSLRATIREKFDFRIIGALDLDYVNSRLSEANGMVRMLDYLWVPDMFNLNNHLKGYLEMDIIPAARCLKVPIIGSVPLERCSDFKIFENHDYLFKIDTIFIEKSSWCRKYPLIVKKLLPIRNFRLGVVENSVILKNILSSYRSIVNFIIRTISTIECHAILMHSKCENASVALARMEIYCPVYIMLELIDDDDQDTKVKIDLARALNLRRNMRSILYNKDNNICEYKPIDFGIFYLQQNGVLNTGDFVISIEVGKEEPEDIELGVGEDVVILRAFYVAPPKLCEKFLYS